MVGQLSISSFVCLVEKMVSLLIIGNPCEPNQINAILEMNLAI